MPIQRWKTGTKSKDLSQEHESNKQQAWICWNRTAYKRNLINNHSIIATSLIWHLTWWGFNGQFFLVVRDEDLPYSLTQKQLLKCPSTHPLCLPIFHQLRPQFLVQFNFLEVNIPKLMSSWPLVFPLLVWLLVSPCREIMNDILYHDYRSCWLYSQILLVKTLNIHSVGWLYPMVLGLYHGFHPHFSWWNPISIHKSSFFVPWNNV